MSNKSNKEIKEKKEISAKAMLLLEKEVSKCIEILKKLEKKYPEDIIIKQNLSVALHRSNKPLEAIEYLKQAIKINPSEFSNFHNLGIIYEKQNMLREAKICYFEVVKLKPDAHFIFTRLGHILFTEANFKDSLKAYNSVIEINGKDAFHANLGKGLCLSRLGYKKEAKACLEIVQKNKTKDIETIKGIAFLYLDLGILSKGIELSRRTEGEIIFSTKTKSVKFLRG